MQKKEICALKCSSSAQLIPHSSSGNSCTKFDGNNIGVLKLLQPCFITNHFLGPSLYDAKSVIRVRLSIFFSLYRFMQWAKSPRPVEGLVPEARVRQSGHRYGHERADRPAKSPGCNGNLAAPNQHGLNQSVPQF